MVAPRPDGAFGPRPPAVAVDDALDGCKLLAEAGHRLAPAPPSPAPGRRLLLPVTPVIPSPPGSSTPVLPGPNARVYAIAPTPRGAMASLRAFA
jgi:hypothetical protein